MNEDLKREIAGEVARLLARSGFASDATGPSQTVPEHVSQERFRSLEDIADQIIAGLNGTRDCPYEPTAKPCDNCSMCSSRGF